MYFGLEKRPVGAFWADNIVFWARDAPRRDKHRVLEPKRSWKLVQGGGTSGRLIPRVRGTRGSLPEGTSQPDDPGGVGGFVVVLI